MRKITRLLTSVSIVLILVIVHVHCDSVMGKVPSTKIPPASYKVISLAFTVSDKEVTEIKARVRNNGGIGGVYNITLLIDGNEVATKAITVAPSNTETVFFECSISKNDGHIVELDSFIIPIDQLTALTFADSQILIIGGDSIFVDILQPQQIIKLLPSEPNDIKYDDAMIVHNYVWLFAGTKWVWELSIPEPLYNYFKELKRPSANDYSVYVTNPIDDIYIDKLVSELDRTARENGYNTLETIQFVAAFVQGLPYTSDIETTGYSDYPRYPVETLADFGGDCEDTAILLAALLDRMGQDVVLIAYPDHHSIGILGDQDTYGTYWEYNGGEYFYLETSIGGWKIGEIPDHLINVPARIYTLD